ncbi:MAG: hypothetical protein EBU90_02220 [Proteobacteria bacterium]|nr:hypothetical protein [Pseudomonadota bacterium]
MGIVYYFGHLYRKYNHSMVKSETELKDCTVSHLFFDYNSLIHPCAQAVLRSLDPTIRYAESALTQLIIDETIRYTQWVISVVSPSVVWIFIDGVAPRAKINQQRSRRYKSHLGDKGDTVYWNTNKITPGTHFMQSLKERLLSLQTENFIVNASDIPGEGEHKMTSVIGDLETDETICVYGLDADLIMLSLVNKNSDKIVLLRDSDRDQSKFTYVDIRKLKGCILSEYHSKGGFIDTDNVRTFLYDYLLLCILLGNDFLEHIPSLSIKHNGIQTLLRCYRNSLEKTKKQRLVKEELITAGQLHECIDMSVLGDIFMQLAKAEDYYFAGRVEQRSLEITNTEKMHYYDSHQIRFGEPGYKNRYYMFYGISDKNIACREYMKGLTWVIGYYFGHLHNNWTYYYPFLNAPFASDLYMYTRAHPLSPGPFKKTEPMKSLEQLFMVLPRDSLLEILEEINKPVHQKFIRFLRTGSLDLIYPKKIYIDTHNCEHLWQAKVLLDNFPDNFTKMFL